MKEVKTSNLRLRISLNQMRRVGESLHFGGSQAENYPCPCNYQDNLEKELGYKCERNTVTFKNIGDLWKFRLCYIQQLQWKYHELYCRSMKKYHKDKAEEDEAARWNVYYQTKCKFQKWLNYLLSVYCMLYIVINVYSIHVYILPSEFPLLIFSPLHGHFRFR